VKMFRVTKLSRRLGSALALLLSLTASAWSVADKDSDTFLELARQASAKSDIRTGDPFRLSARLELYGDSNRMLGDYTLTWFASDRWRQEVRFAQYQEVQVVKGSKVWTKRSLPFRPLRVQQAIQLLQPVRMHQGAKFKVENTKKLKLRPDGDVSNCFIVRDGGNLRQSCFDEKSGMYTRHVLYSGSAFSYLDYMEFGDKLFPKTLQYSDVADLIVQVKVTELKTISAAEDAVLSPLLDTQPQDRCDNPQSAKMLNSKAPDFDAIAYKYLRPGERTDVIVSGVVSTDGNLEDLHVLQTGSNEVNAATINALRKWKFQPALCGEKPVVTELLFHFPYQHSALPDSDCFGIGCNYRSPRHTPVYIVATGTVLYTP
jgi:TonB family protein